MERELDSRHRIRLDIVMAMGELPALPESRVAEMFAYLALKLSASGMRELAGEALDIAQRAQMGDIPNLQAREVVGERIVNWLNGSSRPGSNN